MFLLLLIFTVKKLEWNSDIKLLSFQSVIFHKEKCKNTPQGTAKTFQGFTCIGEEEKKQTSDEIYDGRTGLNISMYLYVFIMNTTFNRRHQ